MKHIQLPNQMGLEGLKPKDQLVYVCIRSYMNKDTLEAFPSLETISKEIHASVPTIRSSIKRLEEKGYIDSKKVGRKNVYTFNKLVQYEPFSKEFLENTNISLEAKAFVTASQQYMYKDVEGIGKISMSNRELSKQINMPESTIRKCNSELENKNLMTVVKNVSRDIESNCKTDTKIYRLRDLGQAIIWKLKEHEDRISKTEDDVSELKTQLAEQNKLIRKLLDLHSKNPEQFVM